MPKKSDEPEAPKKISSYTVKLDDGQMEKLRGVLDRRGWTPFEVA
jgi:ribonuclease HIII